MKKELREFKKRYETDVNNSKTVDDVDIAIDQLIADLEWQEKLIATVIKYRYYNNKDLIIKAVGLLRNVNDTIYDVAALLDVINIREEQKNDA